MGPVARRVSIEDIEKQVLSLCDGTVTELYDFGVLMVTEVERRALGIDSKLTSILGWSSAVLGFLLLGTSPGGSFGSSLLLLVSIALTLGAVISSFLGLRTILWITPSEKDWFRDELLENAGRLRRYHIVSMLNTHQDHEKEIEKKASRLALAERLLAVAASLIAITLLWNRGSVLFDVVRKLGW